LTKCTFYIILALHIRICFSWPFHTHRQSTRSSYSSVKRWISYSHSMLEAQPAINIWSFAQQNSR